MFGFGGGPNLEKQLFQLKFTAKQLQRLSKKCEKDSKEEKTKIKKALEKDNQDGARIHAQNAIRNETNAQNYLRLSSRVEGVASRLEGALKMQQVTKGMKGVVAGMDKVLASMNVEEITKVMDKFEQSFEDMDVRSAYVEGAMNSSTTAAMPEEQVDELMRMVADQHNIAMGEKFGSASGAAVPGSTSLVRDLGRVMSDSYVAFPAGGTMVDSAPVGKQTGIWEQRLRAQFRAHMKALRIAAAGTGVILDGSIGQLMAQIEMEHKHARLAPDAARIMIAFGQQLLQRTPHPNVVVHLDTTPAGLVARPSQNESLLALDDHRILDACVREVVDALATKENGVELYRRKWDHFGKTSAVRDAIMCTPPPPRSARSLPPPSAAAVEYILEDAWAAATTARSRASPLTERRFRSSVDENALPASPSASCSEMLSSEALPSPMSITCARLALTPMRGSFD